MQDHQSLDIFIAEQRRAEKTKGLALKDIDRDPHYNERGTIIDVEDPVTGTMLRMPNLPIRMMNMPTRIRFLGLPYGSASTVIFRDLLGYSIERIETLKAVHAI